MGYIFFEKEMQTTVDDYYQSYIDFCMDDDVSGKLFPANGISLLRNYPT